MDVFEDLRWWDVAVMLQKLLGLRSGVLVFMMRGIDSGCVGRISLLVSLFRLCSSGTMARWWFLGRLSTNLGLRSLAFLFRTYRFGVHGILGT